MDIDTILKSVQKPPEFKEPSGADVGQRLTVIPRSKWGAFPPLETTPLPHPIRTVVFAFNTKQDYCHTEEECCTTMKKIQILHLAKGLSDIYYNFCIGGDGAMYEGRGWNAKHPKNTSFLERKLPLEDCLVIGVIGDGKLDKEWKNQYQMVAPGMRLVNMAKKEGKIIQDHNIIEEYDPVRDCTKPGC